MAQTIDGAEKLSAKLLGITIEELRRKKEAGLKHCTKCKTWQSVKHFNKDRTRTDGLSTKCHSCKRVKVRKIRDISTYARGWKMSDSVKQELSKRQSGSHNHRWNGGHSRHRTNEVSYPAKRAVNHAIESGRLASPKILPCFDCGKSAKQYHHHLGYEAQHWLDVVALCVSCHVKRHRKK